MGVLQRVLEAGGISTVSLSMIPKLTRSQSVPRLAGISYPMSRPMGMPGDAEGQLSVLKATVTLLETATAPDTYEELSFQWPQSPARARKETKPQDNPPIVGLLKRRPWLIARLYSGNIPKPN